MADKELTEEERRVIYYAKSATPTNPSSVTPDTPLEELNLNWREKDLPERVRTKHVHRLHPYLGKFIPQLVEVFLRKYFLPGQTVIDPFCGSGTTLVQANELGVHSIGCDISEFNVILTRAKTKHYSMEGVKREIIDILERVSRVTSRPEKQLSLWAVKEEKPEYRASEYLRSWFAAQALEELLRYRDLIEQYENQDILKVILSRAARSARLTTHFDLDFPVKPQTEPYWCYKHSRICTPTTTALQFIRRYSFDTIQRLQEYSGLQTNATTTVIHGDSRNVQFPRADGVITSPPYVGLIDYHEQHRYAYELLKISDRQEHEIGAAREGANTKARAKYLEDMIAVFSNVAQSIKAGGILIVVAGDKHMLYPQIAKACGLIAVAVLQRHVNRRTGRRASEFFESVFIWRKP